MKIVILLISVIFIIGCNPNNLTRFEDDEECTSILEGFYEAPKIWNSYFPAIVKNNRIIYGNVIARDGVEVKFVERKSGVFHSPDTLLFPLKEIETIIDSGKNCIYGTIPDKLSEKGITLKVNLSKKNEPLFSPIYLELEPNKRFSYCVPPGTYLINNIEFIQKKVIDESLEIPFLNIVVEPNTNNFIGKLSMKQTIDLDKNIYKIPFRNKYNSSDAAMAGFMGGVIGAAIYSAVKDSDTDISGYYYIKISEDDSYKPSSNRRFVKSILGSK